MDKRKGLTTAVAVLVILSFVWIIAICALLWGRQLSDFSSLELTFFIILAVLEIGTMTAEFICAGKLSKLNKSPDETPGKRAVQKSTDRRGTLLSGAGVLIAFTATMLGIVIGNGLSALVQNIMLGVSVVFAVIPLIVLILSISQAKEYAAEIERRGRNVAEFNEFLLSHREASAETAEEKLRLLTAMLRSDDTCAALIGVCGFLAALCVGLSCSGISTAILLTGAAWIAVAFSRIRPKQLHVAVEDCDDLDPEEFPELYALAQRAQDNMEAEGEVIISLTPDFRVGITQTGDVCTVFIGVIALAVCSEEELYNILLHEFSHVVSSDDNYYTVIKYSDWMNAGGNPSIVSGIANEMFLFRTQRFMFEYMLYTYASSVLYETEADKAMQEFGDAQTAASALLKLKYYSLFEWEDWAIDQTPYYAPEEPDVNYLADRAARFKAAISERAQDWNELTAKEILANNASHPTTKMRLEALGVEEYKLVEAEDREAYRAECDLAMQKMSENIAEFAAEGYEEHRNENYVEPCILVAQWEEEGKPLVAEAYRDIADALIGLCRMKDAEELFDRALEELDDAAACYAMFNKAELKLRRYDDTGIELMKKAIDTNHNYAESGMDSIGIYCCITGNAEELQSYREAAVEIFQDEIDIYDEFEVLRKEDRLSAEELPDGMLDEILAYVNSIDEDEIERIYLVRKTVTEDEGTSVFIVKYSDGIEDERRFDLMHRFFNYLDTCSTWQFSLFDYNEVAEVGVEAIDGSLVYENAELVIEALEAEDESSDAL